MTPFWKLRIAAALTLAWLLSISDGTTFYRELLPTLLTGLALLWIFVPRSRAD